MRIGVIADTHIPRRARAIPSPVLQAFQAVDLILHAGDLVIPEVLEWLQELAPVVAVAGNNDPPELVDSLGLVQEIKADGYRIGLVHGHLGFGKSTVERALGCFPGADCVVFGHSHVAHYERHGSTLAFNPGSATDRRRSPQCSYGILHVDDDGIRGSIHYLPSE